MFARQAPRKDHWLCSYDPRWCGWEAEVFYAMYAHDGLCFWGAKRLKEREGGG